MSTWQSRTTGQSQPQQASNLTGARRSNVDGEVYDILGDRAATLAWE